MTDQKTVLRWAPEAMEFVTVKPTEPFGLTLHIPVPYSGRRGEAFARLMARKLRTEMSTSAQIGRDLSSDTPDNAPVIAADEGQKSGR